MALSERTNINCNGPLQLDKFDEYQRCYTYYYEVVLRWLPSEHIVFGFSNLLNQHVQSYKV